MVAAKDPLSTVASAGGDHGEYIIRILAVIRKPCDLLRHSSGRKRRKIRKVVFYSNVYRIIRGSEVPMKSNPNAFSRPDLSYRTTKGQGWTIFYSNVYRPIRESEVPVNQRVVHTRYFYKVKPKRIFKARLVVQNYQLPWMDYCGNTFAPV